MPHVSHIIALADIWLKATGLRETTLSNRLFGESKKLALLRGGADLTTGRYRLAVRWFAEHWPDGVEWPDIVPEPSRAA